MRSTFGGNGSRRSYAAAMCSRRVDAPLLGLLRDGRTTTTAVVAGRVRDLGPRIVSGAPWAKALVTVTPVGAAFNIGDVVFPSSMSSLGENPVHIFVERRQRHRTLPEGVTVGIRLSHNVPFGG